MNTVKIEVQIGDLLLPENAFSTWDIMEWGRDVIIRISEKYYKFVENRLSQNAKVVFRHFPHPFMVALETFEYKSWKRIGITIPADSSEIVYSIVLSEGHI